MDKKTVKNEYKQNFLFTELSKEELKNKYPTGFIKNNQEKNRYIDILPKEKTRVKLKDLNNDYINANRVFLNNSKYIVTQAPLKNTIRDFWKMVWDEDIRIIVMLTDFVENYKRKASKYWDDQFVFGKNETTNNQPIDISIKLVSYEKLKNSFLRKILLKYTVSGKTEEKTVNHIQYTDWGDRKKPPSSQDILDLIEDISKYQSDQKLIHCSAGIGRAGTFVMCEILYNLFYSRNQEINIADILKNIRNCRDNLVQNSSQYLFIHEFYNFLSNKN